MSNIYELVDSTNDEMYFSKGVFSTLKLALDEATADDGYWCADDPYADDFVELTIKERPLDAFKETTKVVATVQWKGSLQKDSSDLDWSFEVMKLESDK